MLTCKQVSEALTREDYEKFSPTRQFFLKLHVKFCFVCGKFNRQVMASQDMCRCYKEHKEKHIETHEMLSHAKKDALKKLLAEQSQSRSE